MPLYTLIQIDKKTGEEIVIYGHTTYNVIAHYAETYVNSNADVKIVLYSE